MGQEQYFSSAGTPLTPLPGRTICQSTAGVNIFTPADTFCRKRAADQAASPCGARASVRIKCTRPWGGLGEAGCNYCWKCHSGTDKNKPGPSQAETCTFKKNFSSNLIFNTFQHSLLRMALGGCVSVRLVLFFLWKMERGNWRGEKKDQHP